MSLNHAISIFIVRTMQKHKHTHDEGLGPQNRGHAHTPQFAHIRELVCVTKEQPRFFSYFTLAGGSVVGVYRVVAALACGVGVVVLQVNGQILHEHTHTHTHKHTHTQLVYSPGNEMEVYPSE
jgi:hypothetical protein